MTSPYCAPVKEKYVQTRDSVDANDDLAAGAEHVNAPVRPVTIEPEVSCEVMANPEPAPGATATVTPLWLIALPTCTTTGNALPDTAAGTTTSSCIIPATLPAAPPAY